MRVGTPAVLALAALEASLDIWDRVDLDEVRARSLALADRLIEEIERRCPVLKLVTPRAHEARGSQVSFVFEGGYAAMQALIARGVIGDFRAPHFIRLGVAPITLTYADLWSGVEQLKAVMQGREWDREQFRTQAAVT